MQLWNLIIRNAYGWVQFVQQIRWSSPAVLLIGSPTLRRTKSAERLNAHRIDWQTTRSCMEKRGKTWQNNTIYILFTVGFPKKTQGSTTTQHKWLQPQSKTFHFASPRNRSSETSCEAMCGMSSKQHNTWVWYVVMTRILCRKISPKCMYLKNQGQKQQTHTHTCIYCTYHTYDVSMYHIECTWWFLSEVASKHTRGIKRLQAE